MEQREYRGSLHLGDHRQSLWMCLATYLAIINFLGEGVFGDEIYPKLTLTFSTFILYTIRQTLTFFFIEFKLNTMQTLHRVHAMYSKEP